MTKQIATGMVIIAVLVGTGLYTVSSALTTETERNGRRLWLNAVEMRYIAYCAINDELSIVELRLVNELPHTDTICQYVGQMLLRICKQGYVIKMYPDSEDFFPSAVGRIDLAHATRLAMGY